MVDPFRLQPLQSLLPKIPSVIATYPSHNHAATALLIVSNGKATSISFFFWIMSYRILSNAYRTAAGYVPIALKLHRQHHRTQSLLI